jgi:RNA polymerase sigma factor (sigma-70 family)
MFFAYRVCPIPATAARLVTGGESTDRATNPPACDLLVAVGDDGDLTPRDFGEWYEQCHDRVLAGVRVTTRDAEHARDAVSEAFTRAFAAWDRVAVMERPEAWVYTVAINSLRRRGRRAGTERRLLRKFPDREIDAAPPPDHDTNRELWDAVGALPPRQRHAIALRYVLGFSQHEVAQAMGTTDGTAASTLAKARTTLAQRLGTTEELTHD